MKPWEFIWHPGWFPCQNGYRVSPLIAAGRYELRLRETWNWIADLTINKQTNNERTNTISRKKACACKYISLKILEINNDHYLFLYSSYSNIQLLSHNVPVAATNGQDDDHRHRFEHLAGQLIDIYSARIVFHNHNLQWFRTYGLLLSLAWRSYFWELPGIHVSWTRFPSLSCLEGDLLFLCKPYQSCRRSVLYIES